MQKLRPKSPNGANSPSFYSSPPITTFNHTQISLLPVLTFQPASGKPRPRAGVIKSLQTSAQKRVRPVALLACHKRTTKFLISWRMDARLARFAIKLRLHLICSHTSANDSDFACIWFLPQPCYSHKAY